MDTVHFGNDAELKAGKHNLGGKGHYFHAYIGESSDCNDAAEQLEAQNQLGVKDNKPHVVGNVINDYKIEDGKLTKKGEGELDVKFILFEYQPAAAPSK